jgi:hypothetical protein
MGKQSQNQLHILGEIMRTQAKLVYSLLVVGFLILATYTSEAQSTSVPFTLAISAKKSEFRVGSKVSITITQTNISDHTISCGGSYSDGVDISYFYEVKDEYGNEAEKIVLPPNIKDFPEAYSCNQEAGDTITRHEDISNVYKFDRAGTYTIQVSRYASDDPNDEIKVYSNTITITITG